MGARFIQRLAAAASFALIVALATIRAFEGPAACDGARPPLAPPAPANTCMTCHQQAGDESAALYAHSIHARARFTCDNCHGGDAGAKDKAAAHAANFLGKPSPVEQVTMCGACHRQPAADFRSGLHFPKNLNAPRMACSDCHGAHTVGSPKRDFSFAMFCTNCHGLEYLPQLPAELRGLLQAADEENGAVARFNAWGRKPSNELLATRRDIRRRIGELVHRTDLQHAAERAPEIIKLHATFRQMSGAAAK